jgi:hypothetical protein
MLFYYIGCFFAMAMTVRYLLLTRSKRKRSLFDAFLLVLFVGILSWYGFAEMLIAWMNEPKNEGKDKNKESE